MNLGKLWQWILCICTVNFDLDIGQDVEYLYPPLGLSEVEKKNMYVKTARFFKVFDTFELFTKTYTKANT